MTVTNQVKSLRAFAEFFTAIGRDEDAVNARRWADELQEQIVSKRLQKARRFSRADRIRAHSLGIRLD